jgi:hypothetical protein
MLVGKAGAYPRVEHLKGVDNLIKPSVTISAWDKIQRFKVGNVNDSGYSWK